MTLEFRPPYPISPNMPTRGKQDLDRLSQTISGIGDSFEQRRQSDRQQQLQDLQMQILKQEQDRKNAEDAQKGLQFRSEYGSDAPTAMTNPTSGPMTGDQSMRSVLDPSSPASPGSTAPGGGMVAQFRAWQQSRRSQGGPVAPAASGMPPASPDQAGMPQPSVGYNEVLPGLFDPQTERGLGWSGKTSPGSKGIEAAGKLFEAKRKLGGGGSLDSLLAQRVQNGEISIDEAYKLKTSAGSAGSGGGTKPPPGYQFLPDGSLRAIPGGPAFIKEQDGARKDQAAAASQSQEAENVISKIDSALSKVGHSTAGFGSTTANVPVLGQITGATDLSADIDTILSSLGLGKLMEMKNNSKAGASGMGALSDKEMNLLTSSISSLKQSQSPGQLRQHLIDVKTHYQNVLKMNQGINPFGGGGAAGGASGGGNASPGLQFLKRNPKTRQTVGWNGSAWVSAGGGR